jgi:Fe-S-cluster-containing dehydrogenase component
MELKRRTFLKSFGVAGAASLAAPAGAAVTHGPAPDAKGVLVDTTLCVGCRACEAACAEFNQLPDPEQAGEARVYDSRRETGPQTFTVVNRADRLSPSGEERFAKSQCLHCVEPACVSACPVRALEKLEAGPVVYRANRCIGCRYCMLSCPFGVPKYEYDKAVPYVRKCTFCAERQSQGLPPACTSVCPTGALKFGDRQALLEEARQRVYGNPGRYVQKIFGEDEVGGTSWLYISDIPLESLGLKTDVGTTPIPQLTATALSGVPFIMTLWPPILMGLYAFAKNRNEAEKGGQHE